MVMEHTPPPSPPPAAPPVDQATGTPPAYINPHTRKGLGPTPLGNDMVSILERAAEIIEDRTPDMTDREFDHLDNLVRTLGNYVADLD